MTAKLLLVRCFLPLLLLLPMAGASQGQAAMAPAPGNGVVLRVLAAELRTAQDTQHPMRYRLHRSSPRFTSTKEIVETREGAVARLVAVNDRPLSPTDEQREKARLDALLSDPNLQRHRKLAEDQDQRRAMKVLRALPDAFLYQFAGFGMGPAGRVEKFAFRPNPHFEPPDLETQVLTVMTGEIWIDTAQERVVRLEGHLKQDVDFGWGILGRLNNGGWIVIEQADVGEHQWRIVRFQMSMSGRVLFKNKTFDTMSEQSNFTPLPVGLGYVQAIQMLRAGTGNAGQDGR